MHNKASIEMRPIGLVETTTPDDDIASQRRTIISDILIFDEFTAALQGLSEYSHIIVLFWMDRKPPSVKLLVHPRGDPALPLTGVLASRGRGHPNPTGLAVVELMQVNGSRLTVQQLDAYHGTQILDIKAYDHYDVRANIRVPDWLARRQVPVPPDETKSGN